MSKNQRPVITSLPPGTALVSITEGLTDDGEIHFNSEPVFAMVYDKGRVTVIGLLDHETPLGTHGPKHGRTTYSLVPAGIGQEDLESFVASTYAQLFGVPVPYDAPLPPEDAPEEDPSPLQGVVVPPSPLENDYVPSPPSAPLPDGR